MGAVALNEATDFAMMRQTAEAIAGTEFVPSSLRNRPEAILACIMAGKELGIGPMQSLQQISIVSGNPTFEAELLLGLVYRRGVGTVRIVEETRESCTLEGKRSDNGATEQITWTMDDAIAAGLASRDNWKKYRRVMLRHRATTELCRFLFPDVTIGLASYTPEEMAPDQPYVDTETGEIIEDAVAAVIDAPAEPETEEAAPEFGVDPEDWRDLLSEPDEEPEPVEGFNLLEPQVELEAAIKLAELKDLLGRVDTTKTPEWAMENVLRNARLSFKRNVQAVDQLTEEECERILTVLRPTVEAQ